MDRQSCTRGCIVAPVSRDDWHPPLHMQSREGRRTVVPTEPMEGTGNQQVAKIKRATLANLLKLL